MLFLEQNGTFSEWNGDPLTASGAAGIRHPLNIEFVWTDEELAVWGLNKAVVPIVPAGKVVVEKHVERVAGVVTWVYDLADAPDSVDAKFPALQPWQFWSIIDLSGIGEQALHDAIDAIPDAEFKVKATRKLANPPGGVFRRSDALFCNPFLMMQLNLSKGDIDALWTQAGALE